MARRKKSTLVLNHVTETDRLQVLTANLSASVRHATLRGVDYLVAPMVMIVEGVHNGTQGPLLYTASELSKFPAAWNMKPITLYHPQADGRGISACSPDVVEAQGVGMIMNTTWDGKGSKLRAEAWLDVSRLEALSPETIQALESDTISELSTGVFTENIGEPGEWKNESYQAVATNLRPDHLALLPGQIGACSVADGAGLLQLNQETGNAIAGVLTQLGLRGKQAESKTNSLLAAQIEGLRLNAKSHTNIYRDLSQALRERFGDEAWVEDVYDGFTVFSNDMKLWLLPFIVTDMVTTLGDGEPESVYRVTEYRKLDGTFVGNSNILGNAGGIDMDRKQAVDALIANTASGWVEADRAFLMGAAEGPFTKLMAATPAPATAPATPAPTPAPVAPAGNVGEIPQPITNSPAAQAPIAPAARQTLSEYLSQAPAELAPMLGLAVANYGAQHGQLVAELAANTRCGYSKEQLMAKDVAELSILRGMLGAAAPTGNANDPAIYQFHNYAGAAGGAGNPAPPAKVSALLTPAEIAHNEEMNKGKTATTA